MMLPLLSPPVDCYILYIFLSFFGHLFAVAVTLASRQQLFPTLSPHW